MEQRRYIYRLDTETKGHKLVMNLRAPGCSAPSARSEGTTRGLRVHKELMSRWSRYLSYL